MTEMQVRDILYRYGRCLIEHRKMCEAVDEVPMDVLVKAWLKYLPKEDRIIVHMKLILGYDWCSIMGALESRWGEAGKRTEMDLEKRLAKAIRSIAAFMTEHFPILNTQTGLT